MSQVEFSFEVEERSFDIGLDDVSSVGSIGIALPLFQDCFDLLQIETHLYPIAPVAIFSWFNNPSIILFILIAVGLILFGDFLGPFMIVSEELKVDLIFESVFDMEGQW